MRQFNKREDYLMTVEQNKGEVTQVPNSAVTLVESSFDDKIIDFEVFEHYMAVLQEKNFIR